MKATDAMIAAAQTAAPQLTREAVVSIVQAALDADPALASMEVIDFAQGESNTCTPRLLIEEWEELEALRQEQVSNALGDRTHAMAAHKLARLIELENKAQNCQS